MEVTIPVQAYTWKFLLREYGEGPYNLTQKGNKELRLSYQFFSVKGELTPGPRFPGKCITLDFGEDPELVRIYQDQKELLKLGTLYHAEFMTALRRYVEAQRDVARAWKARASQWSSRKALDLFLDHYQIEPHEYDYESLYRQLSRLKTGHGSFLSQKLWKKFGFCGTEAQRFTFKPCRIWKDGDRKQIGFYAYSREREDIVKARHDIPAQKLSSGDWVKYAQEVSNIINGFLHKGYTIR